ncbi:gamma-glutamylcyclotransferase family protein [Desulforhopalus sp. 52FAK]
MNDVWVFFYGTFMSARILKQHGINCEKTYPAKVSGYSLSIKPRVNLERSAEHNCYGGLALVRHNELTELYTKVHQTFGQAYYPYPVMAEMDNGLFRQALCFISEEFDFGDPEPDYINEMNQCANEMNAPRSYILHIESFRKEA